MDMERRRQRIRLASGALAFLAVAVPPASAQAPAAPTVTAVTVNVNIGNYTARCPAKLVFKGTITVAALPKAPVTYQWIRSDNTKSAKRTIKMTATTAVVTENWQGGRSGEQMRLWQKLQILTPKAVTSDQADAIVLCR